MCAMLFVLSGPWKKQGRRQERGPGVRNVATVFQSVWILETKYLRCPVTGNNRAISSL